MQHIFTGLVIVAECTDFKNPMLVAMTLAGHYDDMLLQTFYYTAHHKISEKDEYKTDERAAYGLNNLKDDIRYAINCELREEERRLEVPSEWK